MIISCDRLLSLFSLWLAFFSSFSYASQTFNWSFIDIPDATLSACKNASISLSIDPGNPPVPPYYLFAYEAAGPTTITNLGSDIADLTWLVNHPSGTNLLVTIMDSKGNSGGVAPEPLFVFSDGDTSCQPPFVPPSITILQNLTLTKTVQTCVPIEFVISGGQKPYTGSIAITGAPTILNFTMGSGDDTLVWYNRAPPPENILFTVSDATGQYAFSTNLGISSGLSDGNCGLLPAAIDFASTGGSTSTFATPSTAMNNNGNIPTMGISATPTAFPSITDISSTISSVPTSPPVGAVQSSKTKTNVGAIAGGVVAGIVVILLIIFMIYYWNRRRRQRVISSNAPVDLVAVTPFIPGESMSQLERGVSGRSNTHSTSSRPTKVVLPLAHDQGPVPPPSLASSSSIRGPASVSAPSSVPTSDTSQPATAQQPPVIVRQHVDIADASPDELLELPPAYSDRRTRHDGQRQQSGRNK